MTALPLLSFSANSEPHSLLFFARDEDGLENRRDGQGRKPGTNEPRRDVWTTEGLSAHSLSDVVSGEVKLVMRSTVKLASIQMVAWRLKWLGDLAGEIVLGHKSPERAFVHFWNVQDAPRWIESSQMVQNFFCVLAQ